MRMNTAMMITKPDAKLTDMDWIYSGVINRRASGRTVWREKEEDEEEEDLSWGGRVVIWRRC